MDSFVSAANTCSIFTTICNQTVDLFGVGSVQETITNFSIKGLQNGTCAFYTFYKNASTYYTDYLIQELLNEGDTMDEINNQITSVNNQQKLYVVGKNSTCYYPIEDLSTMVEGWSVGNNSASSQDTTKYNCTGSFYSGNIYS